VIVDGGRRRIGLYPVRGGRVLDSGALLVAPAELEAAALRLAWPESDAAPDWPWLTAWLRGAKARRSFVVVADSWSPSQLLAAVCAALPPAFAPPAAGGNVGVTREEA
jgi:hypothetical protein